MTNYTALSERKKAQKESLLFQEISRLFLDITLDDKQLHGLMVNRVAFSKDKGVLNIYFYALGGEEEFNEKFKALVLYKPSLRKAISQLMPSRYTPELVFKFDTTFIKQQKVESIFAKIESEEPISEEDSSGKTDKISDK